jgi:hypothetical protein
MEPLTTVQARLETADEISALLDAAGEAFELIRAVADEHAVPGAPTFATWGQVAVACGEGRDAVGYPPTFIPPELGRSGQRDTRPEPGRQTEDDAIEGLKAFAVVLRAALSRGLHAAEQTEDLRAFRQAWSATLQIRELLS